MESKIAIEEIIVKPKIIRFSVRILVDIDLLFVLFSKKLNNNCIDLKIAKAINKTIKQEVNTSKNLLNSIFCYKDAQSKIELDEIVKFQ